MACCCGPEQGKRDGVVTAEADDGRPALVEVARVPFDRRVRVDDINRACWSVSGVDDLQIVEGEDIVRPRCRA